MHVACVHAWASLSECALSVFKYTQSTPHTIMGLHICLFSRIGLIFPSFILKPIKFPPHPPPPQKTAHPTTDQWFRPTSQAGSYPGRVLE